MKKIILFFILYAFVANGINSQNMPKNMETLIDGIDLKEYEFPFKTYRYEGKYIEDLKISDLLDKEYRNELVAALSGYTIDDEYEVTTVYKLTGLLVYRIKTLQDTNAFFILSELSENIGMAYNGIELYPKISEMFFENPLFCIKESYKYKNTIILSYMIYNMGCVSERYLSDRMSNYSKKSGQILIFKETIDELNDSDAKKKIQSQSPIKITFEKVNPSKREEPSNHFYDIHPFLNDFTKNNLNSNELRFYQEEIYPYFSNYEIHNYHVQDQDGYVNIRQEANASSPIKGIIRNGESVIFGRHLLENPGWVYIQYGDIYGYVHKSRLVRK